MKSLILLVLLALFIENSNGQINKLCEPTYTSTIGQILSELKSQGQTGFSLTNKETNKNYEGYRICEHDYLKVDSLNGLLINSQIDTLLNCANGTLKAVGFILFAKRHNYKDSVIKKLSEILSQDYIVMASSCSDAISYSNIARYCYNLLTNDNFFFKPNFQLNRADKIRIERNMGFYERAILDN